MFTEMRYGLIRYRWQIVGWGLGIAALGLMIVAFYDAFLEQQEGFLQMLESYPPELLAFFGGDATALSTPEGYLGMYGFSMLPVIIGIFAVIAGSGLLAGDEEGGQLDLILAHPVSRSGLFFGRFLAFIVSALAIVILGWLGFVVLLGNSSLEIGWNVMVLPFVSLASQALIYGALAILLSMLLPARRLAAVGAGLVMIASYFMSSLSSLNASLDIFARLLPYHYFQGTETLNGLNVGWLLGVLAATAILILLAWWRFERRDIRDAGEGRWALAWKRQ